jgi:hypothetical protein
MKIPAPLSPIAVFSLLLVLPMITLGQDAAKSAEDSFFSRSLHYTNRGIEFLYAKEQGGLERITGISAEALGCLKAKCHVRSCDTCHKKDVDGKAVFSVDQARSQAACFVCHPVLKDDPDVHAQKGMKCMDCHSIREIHGDGTAYDTYMQPGAMDARCEKCHATISKSTPHTVHKGKLDCPTCHVREFVNCLNCHVDTRLKENKDVQIPLENIFFLVNRGGKVTLANFLSYVYGNKTMITFAPYFSHSIQKKGRPCGECHATQTVRDIKNKTLRAIWWGDGEIKSIRGFIPVLEEMKWDLPFLDYKEGKWIPLQNPEPPIVQYSGWCSPLTNGQFEKLARSQKAK